MAIWIREDAGPHRPASVASEGARRPLFSALSEEQVDFCQCPYASLASTSPCFWSSRAGRHPRARILATILDESTRLVPVSQSRLAEALSGARLLLVCDDHSVPQSARCLEHVLEWMERASPRRWSLLLEESWSAANRADVPAPPASERDHLLARIAGSHAWNSGSLLQLIRSRPEGSVSQLPDAPMLDPSLRRLPDSVPLWSERRQAAMARAIHDAASAATRAHPLAVLLGESHIMGDFAPIADEAWALENDTVVLVLGQVEYLQAVARRFGSGGSAVVLEPEPRRFVVLAAETVGRPLERLETWQWARAEHLTAAHLRSLDRYLDSSEPRLQISGLEWVKRLGVEDRMTLRGRLLRFASSVDEGVRNALMEACFGSDAVLDYGLGGLFVDTLLGYPAGVSRSFVMARRLGITPLDPIRAAAVRGAAIQALEQNDAELAATLACGLAANLYQGEEDLAVYRRVLVSGASAYARLRVALPMRHMGDAVAQFIPSLHALTGALDGPDRQRLEDLVKELQARAR